MFRSFINTRTVSGHAKRRHNQQKIERENGQTNANASQNLKSIKAKHKPKQIAAHLILPNHTQTTHHPTS
ncbi:MAG: hypothetical protein NZM35_04040 [Chitinophagales bacterium]|nr:hypothetical protein [Chitinophagales bacterium]MDW8418441.1 hypothetical protein [Chitinophagales bacterium]